MSASAVDYEVLYDDDKHAYWLREPGQPKISVPSVSAILGETAPKDALGWWGMRVGIAAVVQAMASVGWAKVANANLPAEIIDPALLPPERQFFRQTGLPKAKLTPRSFLECWACDNKVTVNHIRDEAADRGTDIHAAFEAYAAGEIISPREFPEDQRGWVAGINQWYIDQEPQIEAAEVIVGSMRHRFAGRFDAVVQYPDGARVLTDLKTSKGVYHSHLRQLAMYRLGYLEMGLGEDFDRLEVLQVGRDGSYKLVPSKWTPETIVPMVEWFHAQQVGVAAHKGVTGIYGED